MTPRLAALLALAAIPLAVGPLAGAARAQPAVWTVHGARGDLVLFGSVHLLPPGLDWRSPALTEALSKAGDLWFELPLDQDTDQAAVRLAARLGQAAPGDSLWAHLDADQRGEVEAAARRLGLDPSALTNLRPWMADLTLELAADSRSGALASLGVESAIQNDAPATARRHAFETARQQIDFLAGDAAADQAAMLAETAREVTKDEDPYGRTVRDWLAGDLEAMKRDDLDPIRTASPGAYRRLILERNRRWARTLRGVARNPGVTVVVVGAGHMIGPEGLPALLRSQGLKVEGPF